VLRKSSSHCTRWGVWVRVREKRRLKFRSIRSPQRISEVLGYFWKRVGWIRMTEAQKQEILRLVDAIYERNKETFDALAKA